jgi:hypothetical protein
MSHVNPIGEFDIHFDEGAPRHDVGDIIATQAARLLKREGIDPNAHALLMPMHSLTECPAHHGNGLPTYRFDLCTCPVIRILVAVVSDEVLEMLQELPGAIDRLGEPIDEDAN